MNELGKVRVQPPDHIVPKWSASAYVMNEGHYVRFVMGSGFTVRQAYDQMLREFRAEEHYGPLADVMLTSVISKRTIAAKKELARLKSIAKLYESL